MVGVQAVMAGVKWNQPGFRDPDISSPFELALTFAVVMAVPFGGVAFGLLAPMALLADRILRGRFTGTANLAIGACLAVPATLTFLVLFRLLFGDKRTLSEFVLALRGMPGTLVGFLIVFAVGGVIVSLAMRRRNPS